MEGPERRRAIARIREQVYAGHGCTHFEALQLLSYIDQLQECLIVIYASEEWALAALDRRFNAGHRAAAGRAPAGDARRGGVAADGLAGRESHQGGDHGPALVPCHAPRVEGGQA